MLRSSARSRAARNLHRFRRLQADHRLELAAQRAVGQVLEQVSGRGRVHPGPGQHAAQVLASRSCEMAANQFA
jgi:hypothetical protein